MPVRYYDKQGNRVLNKRDLTAAMNQIRKLEYWSNMIEQRRTWLENPLDCSKDPVLSNYYCHADRALMSLVRIGALSRI